MLTLHHFTEPVTWEKIRDSGVILPTWSRDDAVPGTLPTVHLSESEDVTDLPWALQDRTVRITVRVGADQAHPWVPWMRGHLPPESWWSLGAGTEPTDDFRHPHQWNGRPDRWFVVEREIPQAEWVRAVELTTGRELWPEVS